MRGGGTIIVSIVAGFIGLYRLLKTRDYWAFLKHFSIVPAYPLLLWFLYEQTLGIADNNLRIWIIIPFISVVPVYLLWGLFIYFKFEEVLELKRARYHRHPKPLTQRLPSSKSYKMRVSGFGFTCLGLGLWLWGTLRVNRNDWIQSILLAGHLLLLWIGAAWLITGKKISDT
jgi:hypothetical protein